MNKWWKKFTAIHCRFSGKMSRIGKNGEDLWNTDESGVEIFQLTMNLQGFAFITRLKFRSKKLAMFLTMCAVSAINI